MGKDIHVHIVARKENHSMELILYDIYKEPVPVFPFRDSLLFDILSNKTYDASYSRRIYMTDLPDYLQQLIKEDEQNFCYDFRETTLADLKICVNKYPKIKNEDYDPDDPTSERWIDNPLYNFINRIQNYIDLADSDTFLRIPSDYRIIFWFDS